MKINNKENINKIILRHKGKDVKFECFIKPFPYAERLDLEKRNRAEIVFDDLIEVDALIDMLKRFKQESQEYIGVWVRWNKIDIYITKPWKFKCVRNDEDVWGGGGENHHLLEVGREYTLEDIVIHSWHTIIYIEEFPDMEFNSVAFEEID